MDFAQDHQINQDLSVARKGLEGLVPGNNKLHKSQNLEPVASTQKRASHFFKGGSFVYRFANTLSEPLAVNQAGGVFLQCRVCKKTLKNAIESKGNVLTQKIRRLCQSVANRLFTHPVV